MTRVGDKYLRLYTFHKLIKEILQVYDKDYLNEFPFDGESDNFKFGVDRVKKLIENNMVNDFNYDAILIDEVQLFEPDWIDICYSLLDIPSKNVFEMYGDVNQDIKFKSKLGKSTWKKAKVFNHVFERIGLSINYRNSKGIVDYIDGMMIDANNYLINNGVHVDTKGIAYSNRVKNSLMKKPIIKEIPQNNISSIVNIIKRIIDTYDCEYNDIAVIYPYYSFDQFYKPGYFIEKFLVDNNIPFNVISSTKNSESNKNGVYISTIDSTMGLDFKYIILCGLHSLDFYHNKIYSVCEKLSKGIKCKKYDAFYSYGEAANKIYTACSRAREVIFILDDLDNDSPLKNVIYHSDKKTYIKENI